jgi:hypothetical protein
MAKALKELKDQIETEKIVDLLAGIDQLHGGPF